MLEKLASLTYLQTIHTPLEINYMTFIQALTFQITLSSEHLRSLLSVPKGESHAVSQDNTDKNQKWSI